MLALGSHRSVLPSSHQSHMPRILPNSEQRPPISIISETLMLRIFSHLCDIRSLRRTMTVSKQWYRIGCFPSLWQSMLERTFSEKASYFSLFSIATGRDQNWYQLANLPMSLFMRKGNSIGQVASRLQVLPDTPVPKNVYVDVDGSIFSVTKNLELDVLPPSSPQVLRYTLRPLINQKFTKPTLQICSIRSTNVGKIALLNISQNLENQLLAFDLNLRSKVWESALNVHYVFSGGLNLGLGWEPITTESTWNRKYRQASQQFDYESLSPYFFTTVSTQESNGSSKSETIQTFSLHHLGDMERPLLTRSLDLGNKLQYIDANDTGDLFVVTLQLNNKLSSHSICFGKTLEDKFSKLGGYRGFHVLAFDSHQSIMIAESYRDEDKEFPLVLIRKREMNKEENLSFSSFRKIPVSRQYMAQIQGNQVAVGVQGPHDPVVYVMKFVNDSLQEDESTYKTMKLELSQYLPKHTIRSITLFDDFVVILTNNQYNYVGPTVLYIGPNALCKKEQILFFHYDTNNTFAFYDGVIPRTAIKVKSIVAREDKMIICQTDDGLIGLNVKNKNLVRLNNSSGTSSYRSGVLTTMPGGLVGTKEVRSFL